MGRVGAHTQGGQKHSERARKQKHRHTRYTRYTKKGAAPSLRSPARREQEEKMTAT